MVRRDLGQRTPPRPTAVSRRLFIRLLVTLAALFVVTACSAQNPFTVELQMTEIYLLVASGPVVQPLVLVAPTTAGSAPPAVTDNTTSLLYTSTVTNGRSRRIQAQVTALPAGTQLEVKVTPATGGGGSRGTTTADWITLSTTTAQDVLTGIGGAYSGTSAATGAVVTYRLGVGSVSALKAASPTSVSVTFTLTAEQ